MKLIKSIGDFLIYSNIFIAVGAFCMTWGSYMLLGKEVNWVIVALVGIATLFIYTFDRLMILKEIGKSTSERHAWVIRNARLLLAIAIVSALATALFVFFLSLKEILFLSHLAILSIAYSTPFIRTKDGALPLRSIGLLKIFLITYVWMATTAMLPALDAGISLLDKETMLLTLERGLFIFGITLPFDIRDRENDRLSGVRTLPAIIGLQWARILAVAVVLLFTAVASAHYYETVFFLPMLISGASTAFIVMFSTEGKHEYFYTGLLDGTIPLQLVLMLMFA